MSLLTATKIVGIDPTVAGLIADKLGMKLVINDMEFDAIIPALTSGKADIAMAGMTVTEERLQSINFSGQLCYRHSGNDR